MAESLYAILYLNNSTAAEIFKYVCVEIDTHKLQYRSNFCTTHHELLFLLAFFSPFLWTQLLSDIEEHLKCTITQCETDIKVPVDDFDGKVTYGQRRALGGMCYRVTDDKVGASALGTVTDLFSEISTVSPWIVV